MAFKRKKNIQYITTFTAKFQTFQSIYQTEEYKSWSSLVPCIPQELKAGTKQSTWSFQLCTVHSVDTIWCNYKHKVHFSGLNFNNLIVIFGTIWLDGGKHSLTGSHIFNPNYQTCMFSSFPFQHSLTVALPSSMCISYKRQYDNKMQERLFHMPYHR